MSLFGRYIGIDYSGAGRPTEPVDGIRVCTATTGTMPSTCPCPSRRKWSRAALAEWLVEQLQQPRSTLVGIDHPFSFPVGYFKVHHLKSWDAFLQHFEGRWNTCQSRVADVVNWREFDAFDRRGSLRLTEKFTSSARSVFNPNGRPVAFSTFAGLPWLADLRTRFRGKIHFWPFDDWEVPAGKSVVAEVYPAIFSRRYDRQEESGHAHDAYCVCRWLCETDAADTLKFYFQPLLSGDQRLVAHRQEGWILGVA